MFTIEAAAPHIKGVQYKICWDNTLPLDYCCHESVDAIDTQQWLQIEKVLEFSSRCLCLLSYRRVSKQRSKLYLCCQSWGTRCKLISQWYHWQTDCQTQRSGISTCRDIDNWKRTRRLSAGLSHHGFMWSVTCTAGSRRPCGSSEKHKYEYFNNFINFGCIQHTMLLSFAHN